MSTPAWRRGKWRKVFYSILHSPVCGSRRVSLVNINCNCYPQESYQKCTIEYLTWLIQLLSHHSCSRGKWELAPLTVVTFRVKSLTLTIYLPVKIPKTGRVEMWPVGGEMIQESSAPGNAHAYTICWKEPYYYFWPRLFNMHWVEGSFHWMFSEDSTQRPKGCG